MANRKTPGREPFRKEMEHIDADIPNAYSARVLELLQKNGYALTLRAKLAPKGRDTKDGLMTYINNVRKGHTVDWDVLAALQALVKEVKKATTLEAQEA
ncbi:MAG: hypothetical protein NVS3B25_34780 [Hymenobacter sp.]